MDNAEKEKIIAWKPDTALVIGIAATNHPEQKRFTNFSRQWEELSGAIQWEPADGVTNLPGFLLKPNIQYSALPLERELSPFLKGLDSLGTPNLPAGIKKALDRITDPCRLKLYIALQCPHCPAMVEALIPLAGACDKIQLQIIDGTLFPDTARADKVMAAPCLILSQNAWDPKNPDQKNQNQKNADQKNSDPNNGDQEIRWTGAVAAEEILDMILNKGSANLDTPALKTILEEGRADWITTQMISRGQLFKGFTGLLLHDTWSVRLGAMVVVESLSEQAKDLCAALEKELTQVFDTQSVPVQGDILYALGEIGTPATRAWIFARLPQLTHEDLIDAANDAVQSIDDRY